MKGRTFDIQGRLLGFPYDWRRPTLRKFADRLWNPGGPPLSPKAFGWGYTANLASKGFWFLAAIVILGTLHPVLFSGLHG